MSNANTTGFKVGSRVQRYEKGQLVGGIIEILVPAIRTRSYDYYRLSEQDKREMTTFATVKWDSGSTEEKDASQLQPEDTEIEKQFRATAKEALAEIDAKVDTARQALSEAVALSEKHGIPFQASVSPLSQPYFPRSFEEKFEGINTEVVNEVTETYNEYGGSGWAHSAVC